MGYPPRSGDAWLTHWATKTTPDPETGCWPWPGSVDRDGYAQASYQGRMRRATNVVHELLLGPIPEGHHVDHVWAWGCRDKSCWWIGHLEAVTLPENNRRREAVRTHCRRGHPWTAANTYHSPQGKRQCIACQRQRAREWARARRTRLRDPA